MAKKIQKKLPRRKEEFTYHGFNAEALKSMTIEELLPVMPSRARRKVLRGWTISEDKLLADMRKGDNRVKTHVRDMIILPEMIGREIEIYNGKEFVKVEIQPEAVFHYLGEFALTRRKVAHGSAGIGATRSSKFVPLK
ncbi:MAG TPA: 30S ribosomal protein S19 [Methanospirillum sp.]|jgi:small subunit ribosomal protein S19|uniref:30S ribosomal protein S19 n=1 Tax=Methanospirillum sp. TaxID=45200 RepID=UPI002CE7A0C2|nr:30S ribosomal protein S19 [Methanospirillum sp.]HWQ65207.1 30S ribosomal protein S19 [Methanospirillum sp.]